MFMSIFMKSRRHPGTPSVIYPSWTNSIKSFVSCGLFSNYGWNLIESFTRFQSSFLTEWEESGNVISTFHFLLLYQIGWPKYAFVYMPSLYLGLNHFSVFVIMFFTTAARLTGFFKLWFLCPAYFSRTPTCFLWFVLRILALKLLTPDITLKAKPCFLKSIFLTPPHKFNNLPLWLTCFKAAMHAIWPQAITPRAQ